MILCLKDFLFKIQIKGKGNEREMHRKLCVHAQFSVLMVRLCILYRVNSLFEPKLKGRGQNEFDIAFDDNYN